MNLGVTFFEKGWGKDSGGKINTIHAWGHLNYTITGIHAKL